MALTDDILTILFDYSGGYRLMRQQLLNPTFPRTRRDTNVNQKTLYVTMARLQQRGLIEKKKGVWDITRRGREYLEKKLDFLLPSHSPKLSRRKEKNMIIAFDIPEKDRRKRAWLRAELVLLGFIPIQKSVWFGPAPLPREFIRSASNLNILQHLKFFEVKETDIV